MRGSGFRVQGFFFIACAFFIPARALVCVCERVRLCGVVGRGSGLLKLSQFSVQLEQSLLPPGKRRLKLSH